MTTTVTPNPSWYNVFSASNSVALVSNPPGNQPPASYVAGGNTGTWYQPGQGSPAWEAAHEAGHLMLLPDQYTATVTNGQRTTTPNPGFATNIMGAYGQTGVTQQDIDNVITANTPWYSALWNSVTDFFSPTAGVGAAGGFLIYPNKPNNNQLQSAYSK